MAWNTYTTKAKKVLTDLGYTFKKTDVWIYQEKGKVVESNRSLGDLVNKVIKSIGGI